VEFPVAKVAHLYLTSFPFSFGFTRSTSNDIVRSVRRNRTLGGDAAQRRAPLKGIDPSMK